jgi:hypothetical protein
VLARQHGCRRSDLPQRRGDVQRALARQDVVHGLLPYGRDHASMQSRSPGSGGVANERSRTEARNFTPHSSRKMVSTSPWPVMWAPMSTSRSLATKCGAGSASWRAIAPPVECPQTGTGRPYHRRTCSAPLRQWAEHGGHNVPARP